MFQNTTLGKIINGAQLLLGEKLQQDVVNQQGCLEVTEPVPKCQMQPRRQASGSESLRVGCWCWAEAGGLPVQGRSQGKTMPGKGRRVAAQRG